MRSGAFTLRTGRFITRRLRSVDSRVMTAGILSHFGGGRDCHRCTRGSSSSGDEADDSERFHSDRVVLTTVRARRSDVRVRYVRALSRDATSHR